MKIAYINLLGNIKNDSIFKKEEELQKNPTINDRLDRWMALKDYLKEKSIEIHTHDTYKNCKEPDYWLVQDPILKTFLFLIFHRISFKKVILILTEQPVANPWGWKYLSWYKHFFKIILTWNTELCKKGPPFTHYKVPVGFDQNAYPKYKDNPKTNLCLMIHSNQTSDMLGELYTLRRDIIRYFEKRGDNLLDLYGFRWNTDKTPSPFYTTAYKGLANDKNDAFSKHYFTFAIENSVNPGMYEYDIFISMATGTVPIFLPPPDYKDSLPENTFVNFASYGSLDELVTYLQSVVGTPKYDEYRKNGWNFIHSDKYSQFSIETFCRNIHEAIKKISK
ncbi:MAG: glycosyltransferase family 10 [Candidatus Pacebacteria bacterium]|nr:glycosyltransferase family 10 [Candidatus Paceibacterota bacterium]